MAECVLESTYIRRIAGGFFLSWHWPNVRAKHTTISYSCTWLILALVGARLSTIIVSSHVSKIARSKVYFGLYLVASQAECSECSMGARHREGDSPIPWYQTTLRSLRQFIGWLVEGAPCSHPRHSIHKPLLPFSQPPHRSNTPQSQSPTPQTEPYAHPQTRCPFPGSPPLAFQYPYLIALLHALLDR